MDEMDSGQTSSRQNRSRCSGSSWLRNEDQVPAEDYAKRAAGNGNLK